MVVAARGSASTHARFPSYLVIGLAGVWNFRTSDKEQQERADRPGADKVRIHSRPIDDFTRVTWKRRRVFVTFDSDAGTKPDVRRAEEALTAELTKRGAYGHR